MDLKKFFVGALTALAVTINFSPVSAEGKVEVFGEEFEEKLPKSPEVSEPFTVEVEPPKVSVNIPKETPTNQTAKEIVEEVSPPPAKVSEGISKAAEVVEEISPTVEVREEIPQTVEVIEEIPQTKEEVKKISEPEVKNAVSNLKENIDEEVKNNLEITYTSPEENSSVTTIQTPAATNSSSERRETSSTKGKSLKTQKARFIKLTMDSEYIYYLDRESVTWRRIPYSASEYMADVWIRMIERDSSNDLEDYYMSEDETDEIVFAAEQGKKFRPEDVEVLRHGKYFLEHYYLRPKTKQIQFLSELEVVGHPQNTISERKYDYQNWEDLIPGSIESTIYRTVIKIIGTGGGGEQGHMSFADMLEEYARISIR